MVDVAGGHARIGRSVAAFLDDQFGTQAAAAGVPLRTLHEWMGHRDHKTTLIYADHAPRSDVRASERWSARSRLW